MKTYRSKQTGLFVGRQADQVEGEDYDTVEVPTNPKEDLIKFLNERKPDNRQVSDSLTAAPVEPSGSGRSPSWLREWQMDMEEQGKHFDLSLELDEAILRAPLQQCFRLAELVYSRLGDFAGRVKEKP